MSFIPVNILIGWSRNIIIIIEIKNSVLWCAFNRSLAMVTLTIRQGSNKCKPILLCVPSPPRKPYHQHTVRKSVNDGSVWLMRSYILESTSIFTPRSSVSWSSREITMATGPAVFAVVPVSVPMVISRDSSSSRYGDFTSMRPCNTKAHRVFVLSCLHSWETHRSKKWRTKHRSQYHIGIKRTTTRFALSNPV